MAITPSPATNNFSTPQILTIMQQAQQGTLGLPAGAAQPAIARTATTPQQGTTPQAPATEGKGKGKGRGKPDHAGGPKKAKALPPGLQGKDLPAGNPWKALADKLAEEQKAQQPQAPGATNTALPQTAATALMGMMMELAQAPGATNTALDLVA